MTKYGLRARVLILTIVPTLVVGILMAGYFTLHRYRQLESDIIEKSLDIIEPLAMASEFGMLSRNPEHLKRLINLAHRQNSPFVDAIAIFTPDNKLFITSNYHNDYTQLRQPQGLLIPHKTAIERLGDDIVLRTPILQETTLSEKFADSTSIQTPVIGYIAMEINTDKMQLSQYRDSIISVLIVLCGLLLSATASLSLFRRIIQPITNMVNAVYQIRKGQLNTRIHGDFSGELGTLKNGINAMAKSIADYHEEMQQNIDQATMDLRETLEQMEIQNVELGLAKKKAQEAARVKSEFLANMSHELRTPLNGVMGFTRQLLKTPLGAGQREYLNIIERSAQNLLNIINDILDLSKLEAHKLTLEEIPFSLRETTDEVMTLLAPSSHDKDLELTVDISAQVPDAVTGDPLRYQQIITNLVNNAIKFTERGNVRLEIHLMRMESPYRAEIQLQVIDSGIGLDIKQQQQLFRPFSQADSSITRRHGGTGLGLTITQHLVQLMQGSIGVTSLAGQGATFSATLKLDVNSLPSRAQLPASTLSERYILIFENDPFASESLMKLLNSWGAKTKVITRQQDWLHALETRYDVTIIGQNHPTDLQASFERIQQARTQVDKLVVLLNSADPTLLEQAKNQGADACFSKPFTHRKLAHILLDRRDPLELPELKDEPKLLLPLDNSPLPYWDIRVLAVDDNIANLKLISAMLKDHVRQVVSCESGKQAVSCAISQSFDLIFMDIQMPEVDGLSATRQLRHYSLNQQTPVVAVTAHTFPEEKAKLLSAGLDDYLAKPIDERGLRRVLERFAGHPSHRSPEPLPLLPNAQAPTSCPQIKFDWDLALQRAAGKKNLAKDMLGMLIKQICQFIPEVQHALSHPHNAASLPQSIHKMHGGCAYSGFPWLQNLLYQIESQLKRGEQLSELEPELLELEDVLNQTLEIAKQQYESL